MLVITIKCMSAHQGSSLCEDIKLIYVLVKKVDIGNTHNVECSTQQLSLKVNPRSGSRSRHFFIR